MIDLTDKIHLRWMIRDDMDQVLEIEKSTFEFAWTEEDFIHCLNQRNCIGMVAEYDEKVVGFMIYELHRDRLNVLNFAVCHELRSSSIGTAMSNKLIGKLSSQRRSKITLEVRETNLDSQLFFQKQGFKAIEVVKNSYGETPEDAYLMQYDFAPSNKLDLKNRISNVGETI